MTTHHESVIQASPSNSFKKFRHTRNYKQCRKGAVAGFVVLGVIVLLFLLLLWGAVA